MGSLISSSSPPAPQALPPLPAPLPPPSPPVAQTPEIDPQEEAAETRRASLLRRDRSRFGTVVTGFRGLLSQSTNNTPRKTLLGE